MLRIVLQSVLLALAEIRAGKRLVRFKVIVLALSICLLCSYAISCWIHFDVAPYAHSFVAATPLYLLENVDPIFYIAFMVSASLLVFDIDHRNERNRISEVLQVQPVSNLESMAGRVLGCAGLLWIILGANLLVMQLIGLLAQLSGADFAAPLQTHSIFVLLVVDAPISLIAWCSLAVLLQNVLRNRMMVLAAILVVASASYVLLLYVPYSFVDLVSPSSNDTLFISDLVPQLPSLPSLLMRLGALACTASFVAWAARSYLRPDSPSKQKAVISGVAFIVVGVVACSCATMHTLQRIDKVATWCEAHQAMAWEDLIDLQSISGQVRIDPATQMHLNLNLEFTTNSQTTDTRLVFSFNPSMYIDSIELDGNSRSFTFQNGILEIPDIQFSDPESIHTLRVVASGVPNPRFGYFDSPLDYKLQPGIPLQVTKRFGTDSSIYGKEFVALMPGSHWYPSPGPINDRFGDGRNGLDYFELELQIEIENRDWNLVGPGVTHIDSTNGENWYVVKPTVPVPEIGLFASNFKSATTDVQGYTLSMHLHSRHAKRLTLPENVRDDMLDWLDEFVQERIRVEMPFFHDSLALVEVPSRLRIVGGGWRMDALNALPGVILLKERGFPIAPTRLIFKRERDPDYHFFNLQSFFHSALGTDNITYTAQHHLWTHATTASGPHSELLDQIVRSLLGGIYSPWASNWFSPYSTSRFVHLTSPSLWLPTTIDQLDSSSSFGTTLHRLETNYSKRSSVQALMETNSLVELPSDEGHQKDLELILLKSARIAEAMAEFHSTDPDKIFNWLAAVREKYYGQTYRYEDLISIAKEHGVTVDPFLTDWLTTSQLPGFVVSRGTVSRLKDSADGTRRLQISFFVRNTEPVGGFVSPLFGRPIDPILIGANSAKRINLVWENHPERLDSLPQLSFHVSTGLSLNRGVGLSAIFSTTDVADGQERDIAEESDWTPELQGIVIDDLDEGFSVLQPKRMRNSTLRGWFHPPSLEIENDGQLAELGSEHTPNSGRWARTVNSQAFGTHRRTIAISRVGGNKRVHPARFTAELPRAGRWSLEFYVHYPRWPNGHDFSDFTLHIGDGSQVWEIEIDPTTVNPDWKTVGEFDLSESTVHVDVVGGKSRSLIYADAIRWIPID